jgi:hypothetical protein
LNLFEKPRNVRFLVDVTPRLEELWPFNSFKTCHREPAFTIAGKRTASRLAYLTYLHDDPRFQDLLRRTNLEP